MHNRLRTQSERSGAITVDEVIDRAIVWITLGALFVIPLIFNYFEIVAVYSELKLVTLHLAAMSITMLWLWQIVLGRFRSRSRPDDRISWDVVCWAGRHPARWAIVSATIWVLAQVASTLLSPLPIVSLFGADEAKSGYNLYDSMSLTVLFLAVATRFRSRRDLELLVYTLVISGTIAATYGVAQHFGWDPIGKISDQVRVSASFLNTLNFTAYLVMSVPATLALVYLRRNRSVIMIAIIVGALSMQLSALWIPGNRGSFVAILGALLAFAAIGGAVVRTRSLIRPGVALSAGVGIAAIVVSLPSPGGGGGLTRTLGIVGQLGGTGDISTRLDESLTGRYKNWESTLKLATRWDVPAEEPQANSILRPVFGLGPEMYVYSFPFVAQPRAQLGFTEHAHNYELQVLMEQGYVGLLGFLGLITMLGASVFAVVRKFRGVNVRIDRLAVLALALFPAMIGKLVEMQAGVSRVSDLAMTFALFGSVIAVSELVAREQVTGGDEPPPVSGANRSFFFLSASNRSVLVISFVAAVIGSAVLLTMFVGWDMRRLSASRGLAVAAHDPSTAVQARGWVDAQAKTPERVRITAPLSRQYIGIAKEQHDLGSEEEAMRIIMAARDLLLQYEKRDPFESNVQTGLFEITTTLTAWGYQEFSQELANRSRRIVRLYPSYPSLVGTAATAMTSLGFHEVAIEYADLVIATEDSTQPWSKAWYAKGVALYALGHEREAIEALHAATDRQPGSEGALLSHRFLSEIYQTQGKKDLAEFHRSAAAGPIPVEEN